MGRGGARGTVVVGFIPNMMINGSDGPVKIRSETSKHSDSRNIRCSISKPWILITESAPKNTIHPESEFTLQMGAAILVSHQAPR